MKWIDAKMKVSSSIGALSLEKLSLCLLAFWPKGGSIDEFKLLHLNMMMADNRKRPTCMCV